MRILVVLLVGAPLFCFVAGSFVKVCGRSWEYECASNLRSWHTAQRAYAQERDGYSPSAAAIGFVPEPRNRYLYAWAPIGPMAGPREQPWGFLPARERMFVPRQLIPTRVTGGVPIGITRNQATAICVAQLDDDDDVDAWSVSTVDRTQPDGGRIPSGQPFHEREDRDPTWH